jgi:hypothetical protein
MASSDSPLDSASPLVSRRTVARTAAWAAPAILLSSASPAFAVSGGTTSPMILLDEPSYDLLSGQSLVITGVLVPPDGKTAPADLQLAATVSAGFVVTSKPVLNGLAFSLTVKGPIAATDGTLTVTSPNHPTYQVASASLHSLPAGTVARGYRLLPIANTWKETPLAGSDIRWFTHTTPIVALTAAMVGPTRTWLDLRFSLADVAMLDNNFGNTAFGAATKSGGYSALWGTVAVSVESTVVGITTNGKPGNPAQAVGLNIGTASIAGPATLSTSHAFSGTTATIMPNRDPSGAAITLNTKVYAYLPGTLPKGSSGMFEVVFTVVMPNGATAKIGFTSPTYNY